MDLGETGVGVRVSFSHLVKTIPRRSQETNSLGSLPAETARNGFVAFTRAQLIQIERQPQGCKRTSFQAKRSLIRIRKFPPAVLNVI